MRGHDGPLVDESVAESERVLPTGGRRTGCGGLEVDRGLGFVGDLVAKAEQRRHGVEEPPHAGGGHAGDIAIELAAQEVAFDRREVADRREIAGPVDACRRQVRQRNTTRVADRRVATGERDRHEMGDAFVAVDVGDEHLTTPDRPVAAVSGAVERDTRRPARCGSHSCSAITAATWA